MGFVARAIVAVGPASLNMATQSYTDLASRRLAEAAVSYARARLRDNPDWKGNGPNVLTQPDFTVVEDNGNVFGLVRDLDGETGLFRIRFNFQDGPPPAASPSPTPPGGDQLPDPGAGHELLTPYLSLNNLNGSQAVPAPQVDGQFIGSPGSGTVMLAPGSAQVWVEVYTGPNLRGLSAPDEALPPGVRRRNLKVMLSTSVVTGVANAALMAGGDFQAMATQGVKVSASGSEKPRLRSKKGVSVVGATGAGTLTMTGEVGRDSSIGLNANTAGTITQVNETVGDNKDFYNLKWSQLEQADSSPSTTTAVQIPGGVYVFWQDGTLHYYDKSFSDFKADLASNPNDPGVVLSSDLKEVRTSTNLGNVPGGITAASRKLSVTKDLAVLPSAAGNRGLVITPREGSPLFPGDTTYDLAVDPDQAYSENPRLEITGATVSVSEDATLLCEVNGDQATLIAGGNAVLASTSVNFKQTQPSPNATPIPGASPTFQPSPTQNQGISLYVKKDLTLSSFQRANIDYQGPLSGIPYSGFGSLNLEGLIYVWGNITGYTADPTGTADAAALTVTGSLVAYGADPLTGLPGSEGSGRISLYADAVDLKFDAANLASTPLTRGNATNLRPYFYDFDQ